MSATEVLARFRAEVGAAVTRARRASGEIGERNAKLRERTRDLAALARDRKIEPGGQATPADVREAARGFRTDRGLAVEQVPDATEPAALVPAETERVTLGSSAVAGPSGQLPRVSDDDEDFSQSRILY
ncbi:hypothetical protein SAMN04488074_10312 [Lentzea albidocapillata subsp. violacea]|uniref:Uncharacterized protein n=1 Tax=Lentzea albidocapillata subsp. violacea TaxID=128104 RepID=A0A1G8VYF8_9PSEU|nr:hypothetical protein [Lentzea albidocapillata]SDJ71148.1 hypothetical protein SAMN04488074_10312 [Lentzea albidocapillata subsp. violacea]